MEFAMNNINETKKLQQDNADAVQRIQTIIRNLMAKVNESGLSQTSKAEDIKRLNAQLVAINTLQRQLNQPPSNWFAALQVARVQKKEISTIVANIVDIKVSVNSKLRATSQTKPAAQQSYSIPEKARDASPPHNYGLPEVPTTPIRSQIAPSKPLMNPLLDKFIDVNQKLSQTKAQLVTLNRSMMTEKNTEKKVALCAEIASAQKVQALTQKQLDMIYPHLADPKKSTLINQKLTEMSGALDLLTDRMAKSYLKNMPVAPITRSNTASNHAQNRSKNQSNDDNNTRRGPGR